MVLSILTGAEILSCVSRIATERNRLIQKMLTAKKGGAKTTPAVLTPDMINECEEDRRVSSVVQ